MSGLEPLACFLRISCSAELLPIVAIFQERGHLLLPTPRPAKESAGLVLELPSAATDAPGTGAWRQKCARYYLVVLTTSD